MVNEYKKRGLVSLIIREINQNKEVLPHTCKNDCQENKHWQGSGENGTFMYCDDDPAQLLWRTVCRFLKKLKMELSYNPAILLLSIYIQRK